MSSSMGPQEVWSIPLWCPSYDCYWVPAAGLLHQLTHVGAAGSHGVSELTESHLVTATHQWETMTWVGSAIPVSQTVLGAFLE